MALGKNRRLLAADAQQRPFISAVNTWPITNRFRRRAGVDSQRQGRSGRRGRYHGERRISTSNVRDQEGVLAVGLVPDAG